MTIVYTDASWNPLLGCSQESLGCTNCYAANEAATRLVHNPLYQGLTTEIATGHKFNGTVRFVEKRLDEPLRTKTSKRFFVCSTSDMFHANVKDEWRDKMLAVMLLSPWHTYLITTKRPRNAFVYLTTPDLYNRVLEQANAIRAERPGLGSVGVSNPLTHPARWIWYGISAENTYNFKRRIVWLRALPAAKRWLSLAPLLEEIPLKGELHALAPSDNSSDAPSAEIDWVVIEGESGRRPRPCDVASVHNMVTACEEEKVPVYLKQLGDYPVKLDHRGAPEALMFGLGHKAMRDEENWPVYLRGKKQLPEFWKVSETVTEQVCARKKRSKKL